jgi:L-amino acid N-acyltransferase YncA
MAARAVNDTCSLAECIHGGIIATIMQFVIRPITLHDAPAICAIYNPYVRDTVISFEQEPVSEADMAQRIRDTAAHYPWLVAELDAKVVAYAYATRWRTRAAYDHTLESTVYVDAACTGRGIAKPLYLALLDELKARGVRAVVGCIALPNDASVAVHEKCGFVKVAHFPQVGRKFGRWIDVGFWQATLAAR